VVQILASREPEVVHEVAAGERFDAVDDRMRPPAFQPQMSTEMTPTRRHGDEPAARLKDDPRLLRVDMDPSEAARRLHEPVEERANLRILAGEVLVDGVATAGMRHVARDEPLTARRARPERRLRPLVLRSPAYRTTGHTVKSLEARRCSVPPIRCSASC